MCLVAPPFSEQISWAAALVYQCVLMCVCVCMGDCYQWNNIIQKLYSECVLYFCLQNDILAENAHTIEIKVEAPTSGEADNAENQVSGNDAAAKALCVVSLSQDLKI